MSKLGEDEKEKLLALEKNLGDSVIGQNQAVELVSDAILRARSGISDPNRPIGSFMFIGPTGVGKTHLAKSLAKNMFDCEDNFIRIDMSEYMEKHAVSRLIGAPPGYVGYDSGGQLTEAVRTKPYSVILLDEVEKAHPDVMNIMLQLLDDGRLTDGQGHQVDFRNTVVIMTTNLGAEKMMLKLKDDGDFSEDFKREIMTDIANHFRPEFVNRIDELVMFKPLGEAAIENIVRIMIKDLGQRLLEREITITLDDEALKYCAVGGYDHQLGARPMRRFLQKQIETPLAKQLLQGRIEAGNSVTVTVKDGGLILQP